MVKSIKPTLNKIRQNLNERQEDAKVKYSNLSTGVLGNHSGVVSTGVPSVVYVTKRNGQVVQCINRRVQNIPFKPVVIGIDPGEPGVLQVLYARDVWGSQDHTPNLPAHNETHEYGGGDTLFVDADQVKPFLLLPSGSSTVQLLGGQYHTKVGSAGQVTSQLVNLTSYKPSAGARYALIEHDDDGNVVVTAGDTTISAQALSYANIPTITRNPIGAVRLYAGQSSIQRNPNGQYDIVDLRWSHNIIAGSGDYTAAQIINVPYKDIVATNLQLAINELEDDKADAGHVHNAVEIDANSVTVNTGTLNGGTVGSLAVAYEGSVVDVQEVTGVPGFDIEISFTGVSGFDQVHCRHWYDGGVAHTVNMQLYNWNTTSWDTIETISGGSTGYSWINHYVADDTDYISSGQVKIRYYHVSSGNVSHQMLIDHAQLISTAVGSSSPWDGDITDIDETSSADIGEAIADDDQGIIYNTSGAAWVRFAWSRVKTYIKSLTDTLYIAITGNVSQANMEELADGSITTLHRHIWRLVFATYIDLNPITATGKYPYAATIDGAITFVELNTEIYVAGAAHDVSNYYTITFYFRQTATAPASDVSLFSYNTQGYTANQSNNYNKTSFSPTGASAKGYIYVLVTKTGSPSDIYMVVPNFQVTE